MERDELAAVVRREGGGGLVRRKPNRFPCADLLAAIRLRRHLERMCAGREPVRQVNEHLPAGLYSVLAGARAAADCD